MKFSACAVVLIFAISATAQQRPMSSLSSRDLDLARKAAEEGLPRITAPWASPNERPFALDVSAARVAEGLPVAFVRLDQLREYDGDSPPDSLFLANDEILYVIARGDLPVAALTVRQQQNEWMVASFGGPNLIRRLAQAARSIDRSLLTGSSTDLMLVRIPSLNGIFLARYSGDQLVLTSVFSMPAVEIAAATTMPATEVMRRLSFLAREHDGNPR